MKSFKELIELGISYVRANKSDKNLYSVYNILHLQRRISNTDRKLIAVILNVNLYESDKKNNKDNLIFLNKLLEERKTATLSQILEMSYYILKYEKNIPGICSTVTTLRLEGFISCYEKNKVHSFIHNNDPIKTSNFLYKIKRRLFIEEHYYYRPGKTKSRLKLLEKWMNALNGK